MRISDWSSDVCSSDLGIVIFLLHVVMTAGQGNRGHSHCEVSGNGTHSHLTLHAPVSVLGERSEEHTSELQSLMRISYAVFCLKTKKVHRQSPSDCGTCM